ncbi:hypothetical protein MnTg03_00900 [bacterium MnTg03]|nr:hypothetical protein MnTg03_00900 [bacterium MnTg03]
MPGITAAPEQALHQKNNVHIEAGLHSLLARVNLKQLYSCAFHAPQ